MVETAFERGRALLTIDLTAIQAIYSARCNFVGMLLRVSARPGGENKCSALQARCAIETGGYCNPATGYAQYMGYEHAHMRYNDCITHGLASR